MTGVSPTHPDAGCYQSRRHRLSRDPTKGKNNAAARCSHSGTSSNTRTRRWTAPVDQRPPSVPLLSAHPFVPRPVGASDCGVDTSTLRGAFAATPEKVGRHLRPLQRARPTEGVAMMNDDAAAPAAAVKTPGCEQRIEGRGTEAELLFQTTRQVSISTKTFRLCPVNPTPYVEVCGGRSTRFLRHPLTYSEGTRGVFLSCLLTR